MAKNSRADSTRPVDTAILEFLRNNGKKDFRPKEIAKNLGIDGRENFNQFMSTVTTLKASGLVEVKKGGRIAHLHKRISKITKEMKSLSGVLAVNRKGNGFIRLEDGEEFFVHKKNLGVALHGDTVHILKSKPASNNNLKEALRLKVLDREIEETVGTINVGKNGAWVRPDDYRITRRIFVHPADVGRAKTGDKVLVSIDAFENEHADPSGRVKEVLGRAGSHNAELLSIVRNVGVASSFPPDVLSAAEKIVALPGHEKRLDLKDKTIFTIDPVDAEDFDDAIHIANLHNGNFQIGVHIADVSSYVIEGSPIDIEAADRGTSVYLVDRVIPMLPERLSNDLCSHNPHEDKLAFSCILELDKEMNVVNFELAETLIRSSARLTYEQAQEILDGQILPDIENDIQSDVVRANEIARQLRSIREKEGSIDFDLPEIEVDLNPDGDPIRIRRKERLDAHRLVEEFMLLANKEVAKFISRQSPPRPFVFRVHEQPDFERLETLANFVRPFGHSLKLSGSKVKSQDFAGLIRSVGDKRYKTVVVDAALRAMAKARYTTENLGHFGLGFQHYTHFTSPIRRYPDLLVHRLLKRYAAGQSNPRVEDLESICEHSSAKEKAATEAERESVRYKQAVFMTKHLGDTFDGVVTGVTKFGIFVNLTEVLVDGMIALRDLDDHYRLDEQNYRLVGTQSGRTFSSGDQVNVTVVRVDTESREIDLFLAEDDIIQDSSR